MKLARTFKNFQLFIINGKNVVFTRTYSELSNTSNELS